MEEKTILFGSINPEKANLLKLIESGASNGDLGLSDSTINEINKELSVSSLDDLAEKFPLGMERNLYASLAKLIDDKKHKKYVMTDAAEIFGKMLPVSSEQAQRLVRERNRLIIQLRRQARNADHMADLYGQLREIVSSDYDACTLTVCVIEDICNGLENMEENNTDRSLPSDIPGVPVQVVCKSVQSEKPIYYLREQEQERYLNLLNGFAQQYKEACASGQKWEILMSWLSIPAYLSGRNAKMLVQVYDKYTGLYRSICREYWLRARPVVETYLGIKLFFDRAAAKHETRQLLIANISMQDMEHERNRQKLDVYLQTTNTKLYDREKIGNAVIPEFAFPGFPVKDVVENIFGRYHIPVRYSDAERPKLPVLTADDAVYTPYPELAYDEMEHRIRVLPGRQIWFDDIGDGIGNSIGLGIERIFIEEHKDDRYE